MLKCIQTKNLLLRIPVPLLLSRPPRVLELPCRYPPPPKKLAPGKRVVRVMPNTPCLVSEMAAAFCMGSLATDEDKKLLEGLLGSVGYAIEVPESKIDGEIRFGEV